MDTYKINKANEIYSKMQGILWAKEKNIEYQHYGACENCDIALEDLRKELEELHLTPEESQQTGYGHIDYDIADRYEALYR